MTRFFAAWTTQDAVRCTVAPRIRIQRLACSIAANTYKRPGQSDGLEEIARQERRNVYLSAAWPHAAVIPTWPDARAS